MTSGAIRETREAAVLVSGTVEVDPADPVFAGHYPGFPLLPGVYLIEYVHAAVSATPRVGGARPVAVDRAKYHRPVRPGDVLLIEATLTRDDGQLACVATVSTAEGKAAELRLRYPGGVR